MNWIPFINILFVVIIIRLIITTFIHRETFNSNIKAVSGIQFKAEDWNTQIPVIDGNSADLDKFIAAKKKSPHPSDDYDQLEGSPNISDNITDPSMFFKINKPTENPQIMTISGPAQLINAPAYQTQSGPEWKYQNESSMNGGKWGHLMGFDATDNFYGEFDSNNTFTSNLPNCNDDIRNGMGIPQKDKIRLNI